MSDVDPSPERIARVGEAIGERMQQLGLTYSNIATAGGPSRLIARGLVEQGRWIRRRDVRAKFSLALGWEADAIDRLARGEEPLEREARSSDAEELSRLAEAVQGLQAQVAGIEGQNAELHALMQRALRALGAKQPPHLGPPAL